MNIFGRRQKEVTDMPPQEPRLLGLDRAQYSQSAADAFIEVVMKAADAQRPGRIGADHEGPLDRATALKDAVDIASVYCNEELLSRMRAFQEAVIEESMGGGSKARTDAARDHFTTGCRRALGSDK